MKAKINKLLVYLLVLMLVGSTFGFNVEKARALNDQENKIQENDAVTFDKEKAITSIYLNGESGNDESDGLSKETALKTFEKAKLMASENKDITKIYVVGTVDIQGDINLSDTNAKVIRGNDFAGNLFKVSLNQEVNMSNITIDGNGDALVDKKSMIYVLGILNIHAGTVLENNIIQNAKNKTTHGGAIFASKASINMDGGLIQNNQANIGGGIYLERSEFNMSGGTISKNKANRLHDTDVNQYYAAGGGVIAYNGSIINLSNKANISNNHSDEIGGGISVGSNDWSDGKDYLFMQGGIVENNTAGAAGGGIFIQSGLNNDHATATILEGEIINNRMDGTGITQKAFGGGGIYVNGMPKRYYNLNWSNGELYLQNALITSNKAIFQGGGFAACPISNSAFYIENGAAVYANEGNLIKDIFIYSNMNFGPHSGIPKFSISERMLGGSPYNWKDENGLEVDKEDLKGELPISGTYLGLNTDEILSEETKSLAKVVISGNTSTTRGAGIGSNGTVIVGTNEKNKDIEIIKKWENGLNPKEISVELRAKLNEYDWLIETIKLNEENGYRYIVKNLPATIDGNKIEDILYIKEIESDDYYVEIGNIEKQNKKYLSFSLERPYFSDNENLSAVYTNHYMDEEYNEVFDHEEWALNDFDVSFVLHFDQSKETQIQKISYHKEDYSWDDTIIFNNISIGSKDVDIEYYTKDDGSLIEPYLLKYDLYLVENDDGTFTIKIPKIAPSNVDNLTGEEKVILIKDIEISEPKNDLFSIRITNKTPQKTNIKVSKVWEDNNNQDGLRVDEVEVALYADGQKTDKTLILNEANNYSATFEDLSLNKKGHQIKYTIKEITEINGYEVSVKEDSDKGYIITNKHIPQKTNIKVSKVWKDSSNNIVNAPIESIEVELYVDEKPTGNIIKLEEKNNWQNEFIDLPVYSSVDHQKHNYYVKEVKEKNNIVNISNKEYVVKYNVDNNNVVLTNIEKPIVPPKPNNELPKTGSNDYEFMTYIASIITIFGLIIFINHKKEMGN